MKYFKFLFIFLTSIFIFNFMPRTHIKAETGGYPYTDEVTYPDFWVDPWGFYVRNCTSYSAFKINQSGLDFTNGMSGSNNIHDNGVFGDAGTWDNRATTIGYTVNNSPLKHDIAVFEANQHGAGPTGHVMWVESVNNDNTVNISEYNWNGGDGKYNSRSNVTADHYIHFGLSTLQTVCNRNYVAIHDQNFYPELDFS